MKAAIISLLVTSSLLAQQFPTRPPNPVQSPWQAFQELSNQVGQSPPDGRIKIDAFIVWRGENVVLRMRLTNTSSTPLAFYRFRLPWGSVNALSVAALISSGEPLQVRYPIDDPSAPAADEPLHLAPGQTFTGDFPLGDKVRDIAKALRSSDVIVLWAYSADPVSGFVTGFAIGRRRGGA